MLEDRVLKLERDDGSDPAGPPTVASSHQTATAPSAVRRLPDGRELPVYKLEPDGSAAPSRDRMPPPEPAESPVTSLAPASPPEYQDDALWRDQSGFAAEEPMAPASTGSYRLVGTRLVELTEPDKPKPVDRPGRGRKAAGVAAEYKAALELYRASMYVEADAAFTEFLAAYPKSDYADNAQYWKGETAYDRGHYADALASFTAVIERYAGGNKASDALLKVGLCYDKLEDRQNARDVLSRLIEAYPGARASDIARARLAELEIQ